MINPQNGADSVKKLADELISVISEQSRRRAVRVHPMVQERAGDSGGRGGPERYGASQLRSRPVITSPDCCPRLAFGKGPGKSIATN